MSVKLLNEYHLEFLSLKGDSKGSSESTLVKMPVAAHLYSYISAYTFTKSYQSIVFAL